MYIFLLHKSLWKSFSSLLRLMFPRQVLAENSCWWKQQGWAGNQVPAPRSASGESLSNKEIKLGAPEHQFSQCGPWTSSVWCPGNPLEMHVWGPRPDLLLNQKLLLHGGQLSVFGSDAAKIWEAHFHIFPPNLKLQLFY